MRRQVYGTKPAQTRLTPDVMEWLERSAAERHITVSECLRRIVEATRAADGHTPNPTAHTQAEHPFAPQTGNALRCGACGQRKADHR